MEVESVPGWEPSARVGSLMADVPDPGKVSDQLTVVALGGANVSKRKVPVSDWTRIWRADVDTVAPPAFFRCGRR